MTVSSASLLTQSLTQLFKRGEAGGEGRGEAGGRRGHPLEVVVVVVDRGLGHSRAEVQEAHFLLGLHDFDNLVHILQALV